MTRAVTQYASQDVQKPGEYAARLLAWYDRHGRNLPWRVKKGEKPDPYRVWLSEIMLQQTTVVAVKPYYEKFLEHWPDVKALAMADRDDVMTAWAGLGYYARARNMHACAQKVVSDFGGSFPESESALLTLPGIGPYTAAAVAAIAFDRSATVVDGNIERVVARLFAVQTPLPTAKAELHHLAEKLTPPKRAGDYAQGMMDLGAIVCVPRNPACNMCPLENLCQAHRAGIETLLPKRVRKKPRPEKQAFVFWITRPDGAVFIRRREARGLLGGMMEFPSSPWEDHPVEDDALERAPLKASFSRVSGEIRHVFTHFALTFFVYQVRVSAAKARALQASEESGEWVAPENLRTKALPSLMRKVAAHMQSDALPRR